MRPSAEMSGSPDGPSASSPSRVTLARTRPASGTSTNTSATPLRSPATRFVAWERTRRAAVAARAPGAGAPVGRLAVRAGRHELDGAVPWSKTKRRAPRRWRPPRRGSWPARRTRPGAHRPTGRAAGSPVRIQGRRQPHPHGALRRRPGQRRRRGYEQADGQRGAQRRPAHPPRRPRLGTRQLYRRARAGGAGRRPPTA